MLTSVVVDDLHLRRTIVGPTEADPELVIDSEAVLTSPITSQRFQPIARRRSKEIEGLRSVEHRELARRDGRDRRELPRSAGLEEAPRFRATEALYHGAIV